MLTGLHSVVIEVGDFEAAVSVWARLLDEPAHEAVGSTGSTGPDGRPSAAGERPPTRRAVFHAGNTLLELRGRIAPVEPDAPPASDAPPSATAAGVYPDPYPGPARDGIAGLRLAFRPDASGHFSPGPLAGPTVGLELVAESPGGVHASDSHGGRIEDAASRVAVREVGIVGLDHVVIATPNAERTRAYLAEELGIRLALDRSFPERGLRLCFFRLGGITLELAAALASAPAEGRGRPDDRRPARAPDDGRDVFHGLAWKVRGLEATRARLIDEGFVLSPIRPGHKAGTRVCSLGAPLHGVPTLLIEHPPRSSVGSPSGW